MKTLLIIFCLLIAILVSCQSGVAPTKENKKEQSTIANEDQSSQLSERDEKIPSTGKLSIPLGETVVVKGVVVGGPGKGYEEGFNLLIQIIWSRATQKDIQIVLSPHSNKWGEEASDGNVLPKLEYGASYEMEGFETGQYVGGYSGSGEMIQTTDRYFRHEFVVKKAKEIEPIKFAPWSFKGMYALFQGTAVTKDGKAIMQGDGWGVIVLADSAWPKHVEGKQVETWGMYNRHQIKPIFDLVDGNWRLVKLEDQLGQKVELRGRALSLNRVWWFNYRGTDIYVENMPDLPGWVVDNHWQAMVIRGRLEKAILPRLDQISLKSHRDLKEYFIVREPSWETLPTLLSVERPMPARPNKMIHLFQQIKKGMSKEEVNQLVLIEPDKTRKDRSVSSSAGWVLKDGSVVSVGWKSGKVYYVVRRKKLKGGSNDNIELDRENQKAEFSNSYAQEMLVLFQQIKVGMSEQEVKKIIKIDRSRAAGSGIGMDLYDLKDGSDVRVAWSDGMVMYVLYTELILGDQ